MEVFFYGLFMDEKILLQNDVRPSNPRKGYLNDYGLRIGNRASLIPSKGEKAYGIVMTVADEALEKLYAEGSVADYVPENVTITLDQQITIEASCYNLPLELMTGSNKSYARSLYELSKSLGFPSEYLEKIEQIINQPVV